VRSFKTFTPDIYMLAAWLHACQIETVAMESTGVYWIPVYEILEARGFKVYLVNACLSSMCRDEERCEGLSVDSILA
jgi:transposase